MVRPDEASAGEDLASRPVERAPDPILDDLTPEQRAAVTHADGPVIVVAGPGSGKTRVISRRVGYLIDRCGVPGSAVLAITFTNKAADEMRQRIDRLLGRETGVTVATFHSFCARLLRRLSPPRRTADYSIYDEDDQRACVKRILDELRLDERQWRPGAVLARISDAKGRRVSATAFESSAFGFHDRTVARVYRRYDELLETFNALDFDDLLLYALELVETREDVRGDLRSRYRYILVDEFQDTNRPQCEIATALAGKNGNLCVVGDPDQSIYKWRGAEIRNVLEFERDHPAAREIRLERNYRSTKRILAAAQGVIANNTERREKTLFTENECGEPVRVVRCMSDSEEARVIAGAIEDRLRDGDVQPSAIAVFYRTNALSRKFEEELRARGIRHVVIGAVPFFQRKEVKDVLSLLRILANPEDEQAIRRAIAFAEGFGAKSLERLIAHARASECSLLSAIRSPGEVADLRPRQREAVRAFAELISDIAALPAAPVGPLLREVVERTGIRPRLRDSKDPHDWSRVEHIDALVEGGRDFDERFPGGDYHAFLDHAALLAGAAEDRDAPDTVKLMTLHSAKGLEFDEVFIAGVDGGILPLEREGEDPDIEEERRLFYVGLTRARKRVTLTGAAIRRTYGQEKPHRSSPFLKEIPSEAIEREGGGAALDRELRHEESHPTTSRPAAARASAGSREGLPGRALALALVARAAAQRPTANHEDLAEGDRVEHAVFGRGFVLALQGTGIGRRVRVRFDRTGEKLLVLHYANLRKEG